MRRLAWLLVGVLLLLAMAWLLGTDDHASDGSALTGHDSSADTMRVATPGPAGHQTLAVQLAKTAASLTTSDGSPPDTSVGGRIQRLSDGSPVQDCKVLAICVDERQAHSAIASCVTDADGRFAFHGQVAALEPLWLQIEWRRSRIPAGVPDETLMRESAAFADWSRDLLTPEIPLPQVGARDDLSLVIDTGWTARGLVVSGDGVPMPGVTVRAVDTSSNITTRTDAEGRFVFVDLDPKAPMLSLSLEDLGSDWGHLLVEPPTDSLLKDVGKIQVGMFGKGFR